jgi:hypothetical protein
VEPVASTNEFTVQARIQHSLSPESATPFDFFCLFIPVTFYSKWSTFTNLKANLVSEMQDGYVRYWRPTSAAEIKAFFASSVIWYFLLSKASFSQHLKREVDQSKLQFGFLL